jgi:glycosyltransferase involved in cell wall biosynthesis
MGRPIGFVLRRFPVLSETFIVEEILALEEQGLNVRIFALAPCRDERFHPSLARLRAPVQYVPGPLELRSLLAANSRVARRHPGHYLRALSSALLRVHRGHLWRLIQAGYVAELALAAHVRHLHAHFATHPSTVAQLAAQITGVPSSFTAHAYDLYRQTDRSGLRDLLRRASFAVTVTEPNLAFLRALEPATAGRIHHVYNGIDLERFRPPDVRPPPPFIVLAVARLVEKKGLPVLVDACRLLRERGVEFRCRIVGKGRDRARLIERIRQGNLEEHVTLLGALGQEAVIGEYRAAHVFALPCRVGQDGNVDGLPVSIVEALACGLPVVSTPVNGVPEAVEHERNGLLVPLDDAPALADALERLARDPDLYARLANAARSTVVDRFDRRRTGAVLGLLFAEGAA